MENYFRLILKGANLWPHSERQNAEVVSVCSIVTTIDNAIRSAEVEKFSLSQRVDDALSRAAVTFGDGDDEYLERDLLDSYHQNLLAAEISNGQRRLEELTTAITHFEIIKAAVLREFPDYKPPH